VTEVAGLDPGRHDQAVVGGLELPAHLLGVHDLVLEIDVVHLAEFHAGVGIAAEHVTRRRGDLTSGEDPVATW